MKSLKNLLLLFFFISTVPGCAQVDVLSVEKLSLPENAKYFHPRLDESGKLLLLTGEDYKGLSLYNLETKQMRIITDTDGAGYHPVLLPGQGTVVFTDNEYIRNLRYTKLNAWHMENGSIDLIVPPVRSLSLRGISGNKVMFKADDLMKSATVGTFKPASPDDVFITIEDQKLILYRGNERQVLDPFDGESYIWPSVSPDKKRILAYAMGKGTFICTPEGKILSEFRKLESPVWAGNDHIAGMITQGDGHQVTSSVIVLTDLSSGREKVISPEGLTAMYPSVSAERKTMVFQSPEGNIFLVKYHIRH